MKHTSGGIGYAGVDECLSMTSDYTCAEFVSDCDDGNAYVTGRTNEIVDGENWCHGWGWAHKEVFGFPQLSFTVCWGVASGRPARAASRGFVPGLHTRPHDHPPGG